MRGHGAVVTGTLISGTLALEDEVELYPAGKRARIRGLQVHGASVNRARAGERTAVNLAGIDSTEARRGMVLAPPGIFRATQMIDCVFELLALRASVEASRSRAFSCRNGGGGSAGAAAFVTRSR